MFTTQHSTHDYHRVLVVALTLGTAFPWLVRGEEVVCHIRLRLLLYQSLHAAAQC